MLLSVRIIKLASITQNNHVYEHTAEGPTPEVSLNVRSPYRRQKTRPFDNQIIILTIFVYRNRNTCDQHHYLPPDYIDYFLLSYLFAITPTISYLSTFLRSHRLFPTFLPSYDHTDYQTTHTHLANQNRAGFTMPRHGK
jgi:hypothetical protein